MPARPIAPVPGTAPAGTLRPGDGRSFAAMNSAVYPAPIWQTTIKPAGVTGADDYKWQSGFGLPEGIKFSDNVKAIVRVGTDMYIGGNFLGAGHAAASNVARWDGQAWHPLGTGVNGIVRALAVAPNGDLYVGGEFTQAGGVAANRIARWDGTAWSALGTGLQSSTTSIYAVYALAVAANGDVYAGGNFNRAGGLAAPNVARWNGTAWSSVGTGVDGQVSALAVAPSGDLFVGGNIAQAGGVAARGIARWNGTAWSALGSGTTYITSTSTTVGEVRALALATNGDLYAGGDFNTAGGVAASNVARWDGTAWSPLGAGIANRVCALVTAPNGDVYGLTEIIQGNPVFRWNGTAWTGLGQGASTQTHYTFALSLGPSGELYLGGAFSPDNGTTGTGVERWDGTRWGPVGTGQGNGLNSVATSVAVGLSGEVYVSGGFTKAGTLPAPGLAKWDGTAWSTLGTSGAPVGAGAVLAIAADGSLYAGGNGLKRWTRNAWTTVGTATSSLSGLITAIVVAPNGDVYVGGNFRLNGATAYTSVAKWNGTQWTALGGNFGTGAELYALAVAANGNVYAAGRFTQPGTNIARWNGTAWNALGTGTANGVNDQVLALAISPTDELYVGGYFTRAGGITANRLARWNGTTWNTVGTGATNGVIATNSVVRALTFDNNGNLYVGGYFSQAGGVVVNHLGKWNGTTWTTLGSGLDGTVSALALGPGNVLAAGGGFSGVGDASKASIGIAIFDPNATPTAAAIAAAPMALRLYPNPAHGPATLQLLPAPVARAGQVIDALGRVVRAFAVPARAASVALDVAGLPAGTYSVGVGEAQTRLVVE